MEIKIFESDKKIDLSKLIDTRALICANSGGGKSYTVRKILEESHGKVMSIVLDVEGEFSTLREKYPDFLIVGQEGDVNLSLNSAHLLPKKLLELNISTIIDISELGKQDRIRYAKKFIEALMDIPRKSGLWKPCLVFLDEIHSLAGQQEKQDSCPAVIDLATRGRKRGYCLIGCTQRISKLHKDVVAELNNYMGGRTSLDIDMKRLAEILGFTTKQQMLALRDLKDGEMYVFGPAISSAVEKEQVALTRTTHPKRGQISQQKLNAPTNKIKGILSKLADLPKEVEGRLKSTQDQRKKIVELQRELIAVKRNVEKVRVPVVDEKSVQEAYKKGYLESERKCQSYIKPIEQNTAKLKNSIMKLIKDASGLLESRAFSMVGDIPREMPKFIPKHIPKNKFERESPPLLNKPEKGLTSHSFSSVPTEDATKLKVGARRMLKAIAMFGELTRPKTKTLSGISNASTFSTYVQDLRRADCITIENDMLKITAEGADLVGDVGEMPTDTESLIDIWSKFIKAGAMRMLRIAIEKYPEPISRDVLQERSEIHNPSTFSTYVQDLKRNGLIKLEGTEITASEELFE